MRTSLVCLCLALLNPWSSSFGGEPVVGPTSSIFEVSEPEDLFDEITASKPGAEEVGRDTSGILTHGSLRSRGPRPFRSLLRWRRDAEREVVVRAQGLNGDGDSGFVDPNSSFPPTNAAPNSAVAPFTQSYDGDPPASAPLGSPVPVMPYLNAPAQVIPPAGTMWGANGPQPFRMGSQVWGDIGWLPHSRVKQNGSRFEVFELNLGHTQTTPTMWSPWLFSLQTDFGFRSLQGPSQSATRHLPGDLYHIGWDARLETPLNSPFSPWAALLAFSPSINTDFDHSLGRNAINYDGRGILFFQADPTLLVALGAGFWDRVNDRVIPYVGLVWLPDSRWEWRMMFPQSRISWYAGNTGGTDHWLYLTGEYHVEAYEIGRPTGVPDRDQVELEDWRILFGWRQASPSWGTGFIEAGWVFGRHANFRYTPEFDVNTGFILRLGMSF